ncbi:Chloroplast protein import component [Parasponia andersonii]|uniref:Protein TIC 20 n=1 Tax=Parasponia andersonii TaxID=3476 RepID=A0A2P5CDH6_PARAD|nr:Chloroplast protein import component [Parasponia andersonii]
MASIPLLHLSSSTPKPTITIARFPLIPKPHSPLLKWNTKSKSTATRMSYNHNRGTTTPATDRLISAVAYTLPFFNSLQYGRFLFAQYPKLGRLLFDPLLPIIGLYRSIPYSSFVAFFALYLGVVRNPSFSHYVRFNSMQAVTLDVLLVVPLLLQRIFSPGRAGLGFRVVVWVHTALFVFSVLCFVYSVVSCVLGRTPYLPLVADAAGRQI